MDSEGKIDYDKFIKPPKVELKDKQLEILIALSDEEGYGAEDLAKMIGSPYPYTVSLLGELSSYEFGNIEDSISVRYFHLKDPLSLVHKIQHPKDPVSNYVFKNITETANKNFTNPNRFIISLFLAVSLDRILFDESFYDRERFSNVKLSNDAKKRS
jgi:hypothetical protein